MSKSQGQRPRNASYMSEPIRSVYSDADVKLIACQKKTFQAAVLKTSSFVSAQSKFR